MPERIPNVGTGSAATESTSKPNAKPFALARSISALAAFHSVDASVCTIAAFRSVDAHVCALWFSFSSCAGLALPAFTNGTLVRWRGLALRRRGRLRYERLRVSHRRTPRRTRLNSVTPQRRNAVSKRCAVTDVSQLYKSMLRFATQAGRLRFPFSAPHLPSPDWRKRDVRSRSA